MGHPGKDVTHDKVWGLHYVAGAVWGAIWGWGCVILTWDILAEMPYTHTDKIWGVPYAGLHHVVPLFQRDIAQ